MEYRLNNLENNSKLGSRRSEIKYDITNFSEEFFISKFRLKEIYQSRDITSIYFDTKNLDFYNLSQEGILPRKKIRIRYYNLGEYNLEIKSQDFYSKIKKTIKLENIEDINRHLLDNEITLQLKPKINVNFSRRYFLSFAGRITIDTNINYSICNSSSMFESYNKIISNQKILEIKYENINDKIPISFGSIELKEQRNSKYCNGIDLLYRKLYPYL